MASTMGATTHRAGYMTSRGGDRAESPPQTTRKPASRQGDRKALKSQKGGRAKGKKAKETVPGVRGGGGSE